jgi:hypothetical protein
MNFSTRPILVKNSDLRAEQKFMMNSIRSCARSPVVVSRSELRQEGFSCELHYLLVSTIRIWRQIANEILLKFKTEFFNRIGQKETLKKYLRAQSILSGVFEAQQRVHLRS